MTASTLVQLNCDEGHIFHLKCLKKWAGKQQSCPLCRKDMVDEVDIAIFKKDAKLISEGQKSVAELR